MKTFTFRALALSAVLMAGPALAGPDNSRMPFPALMNALTGQSGQSSARVESRRVPQPYFARSEASPPAAQRYEPNWRTVSTGAYYRPQAEPRRTVAPRQQVSSYTRPDVSRDTRPARPLNGASTRQMDPRYLPTVVNYDGNQPAGTIIIDTDAKYLYLVQGDGTARRYGVGVGRPGFEWAGTHTISRKAEWPGWTPPAEMRQRQPGLPTHMDGGPNNPLGARALYLGSTLYRIHGSNQPWTIGHAVSSGCIRMRNEDVIDLYNRVGVGTKVIVS